MCNWRWFPSPRKPQWLARKPPWVAPPPTSPIRPQRGAPHEWCHLPLHFRGQPPRHGPCGGARQSAERQPGDHHLPGVASIHARHGALVLAGAVVRVFLQASLGPSTPPPSSPHRSQLCVMHANLAPSHHFHIRFLRIFSILHTMKTVTARRWKSSPFSLSKHSVFSHKYPPCVMLQTRWLIRCWQLSH